MKSEPKIRTTRQKQAVAEVLDHTDRPLTVQEILKRAKRRLPSLGIATVYREVGRLCEEDHLRSVSIPGDPPRYEKAHHHHHHFKCTRCDGVYEIEGCLKDIARLLPKGFRHQSHDITLYGTCASCGSR